MKAKKTATKHMTVCIPLTTICTKYCTTNFWKKCRSKRNSGTRMPARGVKRSRARVAPLTTAKPNSGTSCRCVLVRAKSRTFSTLLSPSLTGYDNLYHSSALPQSGIFFVWLRTVSTRLRACSPVVPLRTVLRFRQKSKNVACRTHLPATTICTTLRLCRRVVFFSLIVLSSLFDVFYFE